VATPRRQLGDFAERVAAEHLEAKGYRIRERNYRTRFGEVDIIAEFGETLAFVEVRCRRGNKMGSAMESLSYSKQRRLVSLAENYGAGEAQTPEGRRIDVIAVDLAENGSLVSLQHIEGAVWAE
jgi:putative endonuclease